jgi:hypothetical protein
MCSHSSIVSCGGKKSTATSLYANVRLIEERTETAPGYFRGDRIGPSVEVHACVGGATYQVR